MLPVTGRTAYQWSVESSVYVHVMIICGQVACIICCLFDILKRQVFGNVYAVINLPNDKKRCLS